MAHKDPVKYREYQRHYRRAQRAKEKLAAIAPEGAAATSAESKESRIPTGKAVSLEEFNDVSISQLTREQLDQFQLALGWEICRGNLTKLQADTRKQGLEIVRAMAGQLPSERVAETKSGKVHGKYMSDKLYRELAMALAKRQSELDAMNV